MSFLRGFNRTFSTIKSFEQKLEKQAFKPIAKTADKVVKQLENAVVPTKIGKGLQSVGQDIGNVIATQVGGNLKKAGEVAVEEVKNFAKKEALIVGTELHDTHIEKTRAILRQLNKLKKFLPEGRLEELHQELESEALHDIEHAISKTIKTVKSATKPKGAKTSAQQTKKIVNSMEGLMSNLLKSSDIKSFVRTNKENINKLTRKNQMKLLKMASSML